MPDNIGMIATTPMAMIGELRKVLKRLHYSLEVMLYPMLGFKSFWSAQKLIKGIETMHMIKKGQLHCPKGQVMSAAKQFYSLASDLEVPSSHFYAPCTLLRQNHLQCLSQPLAAPLGAFGLGHGAAAGIVAPDFTDALRA